MSFNVFKLKMYVIAHDKSGSDDNGSSNAIHTMFPLLSDTDHCVIGIKEMIISHKPSKTHSKYACEHFKTTSH